MRVRVERATVWAGIDVGKTHHRVCVVDTDGATLLSVKVGNDEIEIDAVIATVTALAERVDWALDIIGVPPALLLALLNRAGQQVRYASGRVVAAMSAAYTGEGKTDAKDAHVIVETARLRRDLTVVEHETDLTRNLGLLTAHRADLVADRVRTARCQRMAPTMGRGPCGAGGRAASVGTRTGRPPTTARTQPRRTP